ncbi:MAG: anaerobic glycerol-3-phosphate dehydrogenase subunit C [Anaerolineae bacterium]|nr:anaerobic glycerol-3-phosphate dehydrogenase subunit C [Anaerolineae bacterium]
MSELLDLLENTPFTSDMCVKCNICTAQCTVAPYTDLFPGPKTVGPQAQRMREPGAPSVDHSVDYCSGCGICTLVCPHGVKVMEINTQAKAAMVETHGISLRTWFLGRNEVWGRLGTPFAPLLNFMMGNGIVRWLAEKTVGVSRRAPMPQWAGYTFRSWWQKRQRQQAREHGSIREYDPARTVVYFHGCATNSYEPHIGRLAVAILEHLDFTVIVPPLQCCGLPMQSNGDFAGARSYARRNVAWLEPYARQGVPIVGTSASCMMALKGDYEHILGMHDEATRTVAAGVWDFMEFLRHLHEVGQLDTNFRPLDRRLPYHAPCQLKAHGMGRPALDVLGLIPGLVMEEIDADCCGICGTYGYKAEKRTIAEQVGQPIVDHVHAGGFERVVCDTETCRWQITSLTGAETFHPIVLLAEAYGIEMAE